MQKLGCLVILGLVLGIRGESFESSTKTNFVKDFHFSGLKKFIKEYKFVAVLYNNPKTKKGKRLMAVFDKLAKENDVHEVFFLQIHQKKKRKKQKKKEPSLKFYVYGFKKDYHGEFDLIHMHNWIQDIITANPFEINKLEEITNMDSHYFAVVDKKWIEANETHFMVLAKLISPLSIFTGLEREELSKITTIDLDKHPLFVYREYQKEIIIIDIEASLNKKAELILDNEFPSLMTPDKESLRLITEFKLPTLLFFTDNKADEFIDIIKETAKPYKDYLAVTIAVKDKKNVYTKFLKKFLDVKKTPAIRILNMQDEIKRYKYSDEMEPTLIDNFLSNYIEKNLRSVDLNEKIKKNSRIGNLLKANHKMVDFLLSDMNNANLIYFYSSSFGDPNNDFKELETLQSVLRNNPNFEIFVCDHDKNDINGQYHSDLPFLALSAPPKQVWEFNKEINFTNVMNFIISKLPHLKMDNPVFDDDL